MIKLTDSVGKALYISPENLTSVTQSEYNTPSVDPYKVGEKVTVTVVASGDDTNVVKESPEEVVRKIMDYKWSMERYKASCHLAFAHRAETDNPFTPPLDEWLIMKRLAGLEQTP
ncbi:hypothetical protein [Paenibacillus ginsengarvi]|uniref:Uncharacterized protein n=1 Tax=Paenibacillus ginsengarvi TaxID=400777 RepID=A0A3B0CM59_9BACL|nr:hypothetical protein [Paenibacillus ginsengarvi]RKN86765.1 hypothetical protein D7M11_02060 [Paenibacillus ginsengarvi]